jgi:hypothetical protein
MSAIYVSVLIEAWRGFLARWRAGRWLKAERLPRTEPWRGFLTRWQRHKWLKAERFVHTEPWWVFLTRWQRTLLLGLGRARTG